MKPLSKTIHFYQVILVFWLVAAVACPAAAAGKVALVIGNSQYKADPLSNPVNDAADMAGVLGKLGFDVILEKDADKSAMVGSLREFHKKLGAAEIGLFYYAGHGMQINGSNFLIPVRHAIAEEFEVESEAIRADRILSAMESAGNPLNIVILDACRNNPFQSFRGTQKGLAEMKAPRGTIISYATSPGSLAEDGRGRNGTYTEALLKNFQTPGVDVQKMFNRTGLDVMEKTDGRQMPWVSTTPFPDYYLAGGAAEDQDLQSVEAQSTGQSQPAAPVVSAPEVTAGTPEKKPVHSPTVAVQPEKAPPASPGAGQVWTEPVTGMEFVWVPSGCFMMGTPELGRFDSADGTDRLRGHGLVLVSILKAVVSAVFPVGCVNTQSNNRLPIAPVTLSPAEEFNRKTMDERPVHEVCLDGFWMGRYEVTQGQWQTIMGGNPSHFNYGDDYPVEQVSWHDAKQFISRFNDQTGFRFVLPTEAQWEYAARSGGRQETYAGGRDVGRLAWYERNSGEKTHPVGSKAPNGLGLFDMSGNVSEWCEDVYDESAYTRHVRNNPVILSGNSARVGRGGSWSNASEFVRTAFRLRFSGDNSRGSRLGFRLVLPPG